MIFYWIGFVLGIGCAIAFPIWWIKHIKRKGYKGNKTAWNIIVWTFAILIIALLSYNWLT